MARRRMIDPGIWTSEHNLNLIFRQRLLFIGLISNADDAGRIKGNPNFVRAVVFPYDDIPKLATENDLQVLEKEGLIQRYNCEDVDYIQLKKWDKYQRIDKPQPSKIPIHSRNGSMNGSWNDSKNDSRLKERKLKEKKRKETYTSAFLKFWEIYPRKVGKSDAYRKFKNIQVDVSVLIAALEQQKKSDQWDRGYVPNPATWLNQGRWDDDVCALNSQKEESWDDWMSKNTKEKT